MPVPFIILISICFNPALHHNRSTTPQVSAYIFSKTAPADNINKSRFLNYSAFFIFPHIIYHKRHCRDFSTFCCYLEFWIIFQLSSYYNSV